MENFSEEVKRLAHALHLSCAGPHADYCGWFYGEQQRTFEYRRAEKLLPEIKKIGLSVKQVEAFMLLRYPEKENWLYK